MNDTAPGQHVRVDIVASDAAVRESTRILLDVYEYAGRDYASGRDYILDGASHANCLVTDGVLSDMTGLELLDHLRTNGDTTPAVMMTGRIDAEMASRAERLSLKLLEKPPLADSLLDTIHDACFEDVAREAPSPAAASRFPASLEEEAAQSPSWIDHAGTGVAIFDAEHRKLNEMVLDYYDAILSGEPKAALDALFGRLAVLTADHFVHEENYMRFAGYPESDRHIAAHRLLVEALKDVPSIAGGAGDDRSIRALEVLRFLKHWLMEHILAEDRKLGGYLNSRGIR